MKKGLFLFVVFSMLAIGLASASYSCADGSQLIEDIEDLDIGESGNANGLFIGLVSSREVLAIGRIEAEIFIDSHTYNLVDNNSVEGDLMDGSKYNISIIDSDENSARIRINSDNASIDEGDAESVGSFEVFLVSSEGVFPGTATVKVMVGDSKIFIDNKDNPEESLTVNGKKYLVTLFSASNDNALIKVLKCNNGDSTVQVVADAPPLNNTNTTTLNNTNQTNNNTGNSTNPGNTNNTLNETINQTSNNSGSQQGNQEDAKSYDSLIRVAFIAVIVIFGIILLYLIVRYMKNRTYQKQTEGPNSY